MKSLRAVRPLVEEEEDDGDMLMSSIRRGTEDSDDEFNGLSFGSLNAAQKKMRLNKEENDSSNSSSDDDSGSDSDTPQQTKHKNFKISASNTTKLSKKKHKHAPTEASSKKPVPRIRKLEVNPKYQNNLHQDIRFDTAYGKADLQETRKNYGFLDEYRQKEINDLQRMINDKKAFNRLSSYEQNEIRDNLQSLKSRLDTLKNKDLEFKVLDDYKKQQMENFRSGKQSNPYFLKRSEQRKLIQKAKFDRMKPVQREKVMERKRKRKLGKEFRELEFRNQRTD